MPYPYLLADDNGASLQVAKYSDTSRVNLIENRDFGRCSLVKALKGVLERMGVENTIFTKIGFPLRQEREMIDSIALREAGINAIVHNDYSYGATPKFEFFSDRLENLHGLDEEDFFSGFSAPRNNHACVSRSGNRRTSGVGHSAHTESLWKSRL